MTSWIILLLIGFATAEFDSKIDRKFRTLPKHEFVEYFNSLNQSWTIAKYDEGINRHFGAKLDLNHSLPIISPADSRVPIIVPKNFDSRLQWRHCKTIQEIYNQGQCGSCYLFGTINSVSDRTCIHTNTQVRLSVQEGDCVKPLNVCDGGFVHEVLEFWLDQGLVTDECKPYDIPALHRDHCKQSCQNLAEYRNDKYYGESAYQVESSAHDIMTEIVSRGPVVVSFEVYDDFMAYKGGIYEHTFGKSGGYHAVRLIGFGTENGVDYWLLANSWGTGWGENGFFKVKREQRELHLEENVYAGIPRKSA